MSAPRHHKALPASLLIVTLIGGGCAHPPSEPESGAPAQPAPHGEPAQAETSERPETATSPKPQPEIEIRAAAPEHYVVKKGDTLWDLATQFLEDPWYWPEIWHVNPQVENPHLIYPGDELTLTYVGGRPQLQISGGPRVDRRSPEVRYEDLDNVQHGIPIQAIGPFLMHAQVLTEGQIENAPHIIGSQDNRLIYGSGDEVYVRNLDADAEYTDYTVLRPGEPLHDPVTDELLGYEAKWVGDARVLQEDEIATVFLENTSREALQGDRLVPAEQEVENRTFFPHAPPGEIEGVVLSLFDALSQVGQYQVVALNVGERNGIERGHVLEVQQAGRTVRDSYARSDQPRTVTLPSEYAGLLMVFRAFEKVSYGLVMTTDRPIRVGDLVQAPE